MAIDTYAFAKKLETSGFSREQVEALVEAFRTLIEENLTTKVDLEQVHTDLAHKIELARRDVIIRLGAIVIGAVTVLGLFMGTLIALVQT